MNLHSPRLQDEAKKAANPEMGLEGSDLVIKNALEVKHQLKKSSSSPQLSNASDEDTEEFEHAVAPGNKSVSQLQVTQELPKETFHKVCRVVRMTETQAFDGFLKYNVTLDSPIAEIEATAARYYKVFADDLIPDYYAVYNENLKYIGVISELLPGFKPLSDRKEPLKKEDHDVQFLADKKISIEEMERFDSELRALDVEEHAVLRKLRKVKLEKEKLEAEEQNCTDAIRLHEISVELTQKAFQETDLAIEKSNILKKKTHFFDRIHQDKKLTQAEFQRYRNVKGLSRSLTLSYFFMEDDLHRGNLAEDGKRIDFDMSLFLLSYFYKEEYLKIWRKPGDAKVTKDDILKFPNLTAANPYYWPTRFGEKTGTSASTGPKEKNSGVINWSVIDQFIPRLRRKKNAYPVEVNPIFEALETNPVFIYHKYKMLLKLILCEKELYRTIAEQFIEPQRMSLDFSSHPLIDKIEEMMGKRIQQFTNELMKIPEFENFVVAHGAQIKDELLAEFKQQNVLYKSEKIEERFSTIKQEAEFGVKSNAEKEAKHFPEKWSQLKDQMKSAMKLLTTDTMQAGIASKISSVLDELKATDEKEDIQKLYSEMKRFKNQLTPDYSGVTGMVSWITSATHPAEKTLTDWITTLERQFEFLTKTQPAHRPITGGI
jgi:hypothetical protein